MDVRVQFFNLCARLDSEELYYCVAKLIGFLDVGDVAAVLNFDEGRAFDGGVRFAAQFG